MNLLPVMRKVCPAAVLCASLAFPVGSCFGASMTIASSASETMNNSGSATVDISPNPDWAPALAGSSWVSYTQSGDLGAGFVSPPNGTSYTFTDTFTINGTPNSGTLGVMADDSASVTLNGMLLVALAPSAGNTYYRCSDFAIGCLAGTAGHVDLMSALHSGVNVLSFTVVQSNSVSYGLDYLANIDYTPSISSVPEPGTLALFGVPLVVLSLARRRRK